MQVDALNAGLLEYSWRQQACSSAYCTDLTLPELAKALEAAEPGTPREKRQLLVSKMQQFGDEYIKVILSGYYPERYIDQAGDIALSLNGVPARRNK